MYDNINVPKRVCKTVVGKKLSSVQFSSFIFHFQQSIILQSETQNALLQEL